MSRRINEGSSSANQTVMKKQIKKRVNRTKSTLTLSQKKEIRMMINKSMSTNLEHKTLYSKIFYSTTGSYPITSGILEDLSDIPQGTESDQRVGIEVMPTSLEIRWNISSPNTTAQVAIYQVRMVLFIAHLHTTDVSAVTALHTTAPIESLISPYSQTGRTERKVLWDYQISLQHKAVNVVSGSVATRSSENSGIGSAYIPLNKLKSKWKPITFEDGITDGINHIFLATFSNLNAGEQSTMWNHYIYTALNYTDG